MTLAWTLKDPATWLRLGELFVATRKNLDGVVEVLGPLPIPRHPPNQGGMLSRVVWSVYRKFRRKLVEIRPVREDEDRWISFGLSYMALRRCFDHGKHLEFSYVYKACWNANRRHLNRFEGCRPLSLDEYDVTGEVDWDEVDLRLDFEGALGRLTPKDAAICRMRIDGGSTFAEIGVAVELHESTVQRRFKDCLAAIRTSLPGYDLRED